MIYELPAPFQSTNLYSFEFLQLQAGLDPSRVSEPVDTIEVPTSAGLDIGVVTCLAASKCGLMAVLEKIDQKLLIYNHERNVVLEFPPDNLAFSNANQLAFDMYNNIVIAQGDVKTLPHFNMNGRALPHLDVPVNSPTGVACSPNGDIFVSSANPCTVVKQAVGQSKWVTIHCCQEENFDMFDPFDDFDPTRFYPGQMSIGSDGELFVATENCINVLNISDGKVKRQIGCSDNDPELSN